MSRGRSIDIPLAFFVVSCLVSAELGHLVVVPVGGTALPAVWPLERMFSEGQTLGQTVHDLSVHKRDAVGDVHLSRRPQIQRGGTGVDCEIF